MDQAAFRYASSGGTSFGIELMEPQILAKRPVGRPPIARASEEVAARRPRHSDPSPISRFTLSDFPEWGEWLIDRLNFYHPGFSVPYWKAKIFSYSSSNDYLLIKNADGLLFGRAMPDELDGKPRGFIRFSWSRQAKKLDARRYGVDFRSDAEYSLLSLVRFFGEWSRGRGAPYFIEGMSTDCTIHGLEDSIKSECADWVVIR